MGKSLSILALIMKTLDDGKEWVKQQEHSATSEEGILKRSRSTLVIVPSARLLIFSLESNMGLVTDLTGQFLYTIG